MAINRFWLTLLISIIGFCTAVQATWLKADERIEERTPTEPLRFDRDIRPILSENCFSCHGFDEESRQTDLRLDIANELLGSVIIPGDPENSPLYERITTSDLSIRMPPPESHLELKPDQIDLIRQWIDQGGQFQPHWSLAPPRRHELPDLSELPAAYQQGGDNPVDRFIRYRLHQLQLTPAEPADRFTLIRRAYLDLLGFPPSAEQVQMFVNDPDPQAYEKLVRELLDNPHFGERMALEWLDAARYADTNGYSIDGGRTMWLWRDWVIQAFNDNLPYDEFLVQQLAGDLLDDPTPAQLIATGFQRNSMVTHEGGTIPEENYANYNADRVKTFGEAVLGLTVGCAQCHTHKYDPITHEEYFQLTAFFNTIDDRPLDGDGGVNPVPAINARTVLKTDDGEAVQTRIAELQRLFATLDPDLLQRWEESQQERLKIRGDEFNTYPAEVLNITTPNMGSGFAVEGFNGIRITNYAWLSAFDMSVKLPDIEKPIRGLRVTFHPVEGLPGDGWGAGERSIVVGDQEEKKGTFILTGFSITADQVPAEQVNIYQLSGIESVSASCWEDDFPPSASLDPRNPTGWSPKLSSEGSVRFTATLAEPILANQTPYLTLQLNFGHGQKMLPGRFEIQVFTGIDDDIDLPAEILSLLASPPADRSPADQQQLWNYCASTTPELWHERIELENLQERQRVISDEFPTMVMAESDYPRTTHVLHRGDYSQPLHQVSAGLPAALPQLPDDFPANRLGLAQWVTMPDHPLTARVAVNRFWQMLFGRGIVESAADFGSQGAWPSHPELLDWLAVEFQQSGWDVKELIHLMMTSQTYRQSSHSSPTDLQRDPQNVWLARGPRFRLSAELIRDTALKVSGLLIPRLGGPSVNPYTPGDPWREVSHYGSTPATSQVFVQDHGEKLYRRSLYTYWKRTAPPTNMALFDAPNREVCVVSRPNTTTPLQALVLLNDVQFVEASRAFAERILNLNEEDGERLEWAFLEAVGRPIEVNELQVLKQALDRERTRYQADKEAAEKFLSNGESQRDQSLDPAEHAAWGAIASLLLNHSELITRH